MSDFVPKAVLIDGDIVSAAVLPPGASSAEVSLFKLDAPAEEPAEESAAPAEGALSPLAKALKEAVDTLKIDEGAPLALPPDILVAKVLSLPAADPESLASMVRLKMEKFAPVADDELEVAYEVIGATESSTRVFAVAVPNSTLDKLAADLEASGLVVTRLDSSLLCEWRSFTSLENPPEHAENHAVVFALPSGRFDIVVADASGPVFARTLGSPRTAEDLRRELTLSLLDLSGEEGAPQPDSFTLVASEVLDPAFRAAVEGAALCPVSVVHDTALAPYVASALEREEQGGCIDIVPPAWRAEEQASISKRRFYMGVAAAVVVWALLTAALFLAPKFILRQTSSIDKRIAAVAPAYREVADSRSRVRLIRSYEDRSHSLLDVLKDVCTLMPEGIVFSSLTYEKGGETIQNGKPAPGGLKIAGDAGDSQAVLDFKDALDGTGFYLPAKLSGPTMDGKRQRYKFELDSRFAEEVAP